MIEWRDSHSATYEGREATTIGWGWTSENNKDGSENLLEVQLKVIECKNIDNPGRLLRNPDMKLCTSSVTGKHPYHGDSGGPLFINHNGHYKLIGIVSYGTWFVCETWPCKNRKPRLAVYTKVNQYVDWIQNHTSRGSQPSPSPCATCSRQEHCRLDGDHLIGRMDSIRSECSCLALCSSYAGCSWYTWYEDLHHPESGNCYLFSSAIENGRCWPCSHCFSGPPDCPAGNKTW